MTAFKICDLADAHPTDAHAAEPIFRDFGKRHAFHGKISTVKCFDDNVLVKAALEEPANGRVLVVDGAGSLRCAVMGGNLAALATKNGWSGVVIHGCIRDSEEVDALEIAVKALGTYPVKSHKRGQGERDVPVTFAHCTFRPGEYLYADRDGIIVSAKQLV
jgi:regulator of ribonuclease activity A